MYNGSITPPINPNLNLNVLNASFQSAQTNVQPVAPSTFTTGGNLGVLAGDKVSYFFSNFHKYWYHQNYV